jgi:sialic acid synthase SpsE
MKLTDLFAADPGSHVLPRPLIIAEAGVNHEGDMATARRLIEEAKEGGADAIKFQTYKADTLAAKESPAYWDTAKESTRSQHELFKKYDRFWKSEFEALAVHCQRTGIEFISTPFDVESASFLNELMAVYKISSSDITNRPFIEHICSFGKPVLLSTGASDLDEIRRALAWIAPHGNPVALLHCVLNYPTDDRDANLGMILDLRREFPRHVIGYSDHTLPRDMKSLEAATLLGARVLEKHFTHDKTLPGNDHYHAMDKEDLKHFRQVLERDFELLGSFSKRALPGEDSARRNARRSLVAERDIPAGTVIERAHLTFKRPASGISPENIAEVVGRKAARNIAKDEILRQEMIV